MTSISTDTADFTAEFLAESLRLVRLTVTDNPFIPIAPTEPQSVFLTLPCLEALYGGAAGGGKSAGLLASALQFVTVPGYAALLLRRTFADLSLPGALIPLSHEWLSGTAARWDGNLHQWRFPSGASLSFGYLDNERDHYRYQSSAFQFIGFDELTQFREHQYRYMLSRVRRPEGMTVPLRARAATNPGGDGHEWVRKRFIDSASNARVFVPAVLEDNPYLDRTAYEESLAELDPVTRAQLRHGNWDIRPEGNLFKREWFKRKMVDEPPECVRWIRFWDLAATKQQDGNDPDYAAGCKVGITANRRIVIADMRHFRDRPQAVQDEVADTAERDGTGVEVRIEQEPGASAKLFIDDFARRVLPDYDVRGVRSMSDKLTRAKPFSAACERGDVWLVRGAWVDGFLDELCAFPEVVHDDRVDAATGGYAQLTNHLKQWTERELQTVFDRRDAAKSLNPYDLLMEKLKAARGN